MLTTPQAADELGLTEGYVRRLIRAGLLRAEKVGRDWLIDPADLKAVRARNPVGRPKKSSENSEKSA